MKSVLQNALLSFIAWMGITITETDALMETDLDASDGRSPGAGRAPSEPAMTRADEAYRVIIHLDARSDRSGTPAPARN